MHQYINPRPGIRSARVYRFDGALLRPTTDLVEVEWGPYHPTPAGKDVRLRWSKKIKGEWGWHVLMEEC